MNILEGIRCAPSRRSLKFSQGPHAGHFLVFDKGISREDRLLFFMELFAFYPSLVDRSVLPNFKLARYLPDDYLELRVVDDPRHPAVGQAGLYAKRLIPSNTVVTSYAGFIEVFGTSCNSRTYTMGFGSLTDDFALDAEFVGNYGRFANDPRGVEGLSANLCAENRLSARGESYTALVTRCQIAAGEEILMSYGKAHNLTAAPWTGVDGAPLMREREAKTVPLPMLAPPSAMRCSPVKAENTGAPTSSLSALASPGAEGPSAVTSMAATPPAVSFDVTWECPQCGMYNLCSPTPLPVTLCSYCRSPRLSGARLVAAVSSPPLTTAELLSEAGPMRLALVEEVETPSTDLMLRAALPPTSPATLRGNPCVDDVTQSVSPTSPCDSSPNDGDRASEAVGPSTTHIGAHYTSVPVGWAMNVPFLSWQVWDPAVPMTTVMRNSQFKAHQDILLYNVCHDDGEETLTEGEDRHSDGDGDGDHRARRHAVVDREVVESSVKRGRAEGVSAEVRRHRRAPLWEKQDDEEELRWGPRGSFPSPASSAGSPSGSAETADFVSSAPVHPSLEALLSVPQEVERFVLLRPVPAASRTDDQLSPSAALARALLGRMTRRVFAGRPFRSGEPVANLGGVIRTAADQRCRPDYSPLEIPLRYLVAPSFVECSRGTSEVAESAKDFMERLSALSLVVTNEMMYCPCFALAKGGNEPHAESPAASTDAVDQRAREECESLIAACNVALVLTLDALGSPHVVAVATRDIGAFEPLLARAQ